MKNLITILLTFGTLSCAAEPIQLTALEAENIPYIQIMQNSPNKNDIYKYYGTVRQEVGPGITLDQAYERLQLKAYRRGGNAIMNSSITYYTGETTHKRYPDYITGEIIVMRDN